MQNWVIKKDTADANVVAAAICNVIAILIFYFMVSAMMDYSQVLSRKSEVFSICDRYLEQMMSTGYLTSESMDSLEENLANLGAEDIGFDGTTLTLGKYGDRIKLQVSFTLREKKHAVTNLFSGVANESQVKTSYSREAVSYH